MAALLDMARTHAPLIIILAPLLAAALVLALPNARGGWVIGVISALVSAVFAIDLALRAVMAGEAPPLAQEGAPFRADGVAVFAGPLIALIGALVCMAAGATLRREWSARVAPFAVALMLAALAAWLSALYADSLITIIVAVETGWLASVALVALSGEGDRAALNGAMRMLVSGAAAACFMLLGAAFLHRGFGALDLTAMGAVRTSAPGLAAIGVGLVIAGLALKAGAAPLHFWTGAAYGRSGGAATMVLGALSSVAALAVLARLATNALSAPAIAEGVSVALAGFGAASVVIGSIQAVGARNLKRLVAYAGAAQAGCVMMSLALGSPAGIAASLLQLSAMAAAALALLGGAVSLGGVNALTALDGLARRAPLASAAMSVGALSLMGAPLTLGFLGRWRFLEAGVGGGWAWTASAAIFTSLAAVFYGGRLIERLYFRRAQSTVEHTRDPWRAALAPALIASMLAIAWGLEPSLLLRAAETASHLGSAP